MHRLIKLAPLLWVFGCFGAKDSVLFDGDSPSAVGLAGQAAGGFAGARAGTGSGSSAGAAIDQGGTTTAGGTESSPPGGGSSAGSGAETSGSGGQGTPVIVIEDCSMLDQAVANETQDRCYRVNHQNLSFADARRACLDAGGNLVSIGSEAENAFVAELHDGEHWIGATDSRDDMTPGVGPYVWVSGEDWLYSDWEDGQPNAYGVDCPADNDADCFEHCAFQSDEGDWLDRSCWHTIVSVCEWEVVKPEDGAGGAASDR